MKVHLLKKGEISCPDVVVEVAAEAHIQKEKS
jgi:hypothetical protein